MRISVCNCRTTADDTSRTLRAVSNAIDAVA